MDFTFSDEQRQLRETLLRFVQKGYDFDKRRAILKSKDGFSREAWKQFADMGLTALGLPEAHGGLPGNAVDTLLVMELFGRGLVVEPYLATVVLGAAAVARAGSDAQQARLLPPVAAGDKLLAFAHEETGARYAPSFVATTARRQGTGYVLNGAKTVVLHGAQADHLIVSARTSGKDRDEAGLSLFVVDRAAAGLTVRDVPTHDGMRAAEITLRNAPGELLGAEGQAFATVEAVLGRGIAALCAEAVGAMAALIEITLGYIKTRKQFGVPIGTFQVLQHRMADMLMYAEQARSMAYLAAAKADLPDAVDDAPGASPGDLNASHGRRERRRALAAAKAYVGQAARYVGQQAVQLHGGIGVTDEANVSHYFKRLTLINATLGDADHHLAALSDGILRESVAQPAKSASPAITENNEVAGASAKRVGVQAA